MTTQRRCIDYRCPRCNRPVRGLIDLVFASYKPTNGIHCQHCQAYLTLASRIDDIGEVWYFIATTYTMKGDRS